MGMKIKSQELFNNEEILLERKANLMINIKDFGLKKMDFHLFQKKEAIGGKLYVTNYRLIFKPHLVNRVKGTFSLMLPSILSTRDTSVLLSKKMTVDTNSHSYEFVVWKREELIYTIETLKRKLSHEDLRYLNELTHGQQLSKFTEMDQILKIFFKLAK
ncbi:hypothetical protein [Neobacillus cucumis]|uniref:hypothetical protein n=1 Tax=Neobacillus cucumis TaxID=1740721 RepID=UPI00196389A1|nr:hypothetical protein [Neobacillus cucumis]MBM7656430.1 hypothetical protein [Neobacillus cucumis]